MSPWKPKNWVTKEEGLLLIGAKIRRGRKLILFRTKVAAAEDSRVLCIPITVVVKQGGQMQDTNLFLIYLFGFVSNQRQNWIGLNDLDRLAVRSGPE